jgi:hypothetical protein
MMRIFLCAFLLVFPSAVLAQNPNYDRCEVAMGADNRVGRMLGSFETVMGEEELTVKAFPLPGTKLFIVASVFYTDESMASEESSDSMSLELTLSRTRRRDVLKSLSLAAAELPASVNVGRVSFLVKTSRGQQLVVMECRRHVRT